MTLEYLREYRTYFHISKSYNLSESNAYKIIKWVEDTLIKSKIFSLPGRKALLKNDMEHEIILVDASETLIQRPKKNSVIHANSRLPKKRTKKHLLTKEDKIENKKLSSQRVINENVIGMLKRFKIIADKYRNRRKRFGLRFNLIAGIYNHELIWQWF